MSNPRDRRFERARAALHARRKVMYSEHEMHQLELHFGEAYKCRPNTCQEALAFEARDRLLCEIIREFGGRA